MGYTTECDKLRITRSLIEKPDANDVEKIDELLDVKKLITTILYENDSLNIFISHIVNTIKCTPDYDPYGILKFNIDNLKNSILKKYADRTTSYEKTMQGIQVEVFNTIKNITTKFNEIHKKSQQNIDFELLDDTEDGWGLP